MGQVQGRGMYVAASYARDIRAIFEKDLDIIKVILLVIW